MPEENAAFDVAVIGGGINGAAIARDAAGRGWRVLLVEQNDLASGTSSASTKLIHGGLRYLEHGWFRLVREALAEREVMLRMAPHLIRPMRFVLPVEPGMRPAWQLRLGLFVYDHLGGRTTLPGTRSVDLAADPHGATLKGATATASSIPTAWPTISRLVVLNALDAAARGALIRTRTRCLRADRARMEDRARGARPARGGERPRPDQCHRAVARRLRANRAAAAGAAPICGSTRAATSWCGACSGTTAATSSRPPTAGSCSCCPTSAISPSSAPPTAAFPAIPARSRRARRRSTIFARWRTIICAP